MSCHARAKPKSGFMVCYGPMGCMAIYSRGPLCPCHTVPPFFPTNPSCHTPPRWCSHAPSSSQRMHDLFLILTNAGATSSFPPTPAWTLPSRWRLRHFFFFSGCALLVSLPHHNAFPLFPSQSSRAVALGPPLGEDKALDRWI
jgi:hypothetical protein